jgi:Ca2+:H+ antiporter
MRNVDEPAAATHTDGPPTGSPTGSPHGNRLERSDWVVIGLSVAFLLLAGVTHYAGAGALPAFAAAAAAVALLAALVGRSVEQLGDRFGPGATGVLQSALGNLPELFISLFALRAGLVAVVQAALIGSILANLLLVLGLCFVVGGLKHGTQPLDSSRARGITVMLLVSVAAMLLPSVAHLIHAPAAEHETTLSVIASVFLLLLFLLTLPASLRRSDDPGRPGGPDEAEKPRWALPFAVGMLAASAVAAAFVSDWFVDALQPAMSSIGISEAFAGLVVVAIAGNAIENVVGVQLAAKNRSEYAFAVVINSPLQIALVLAPLLVILSSVLGFTSLTLVFSPLLVVSVAVAVLLSAFITFDGKSTWIEGAGLLALYGVIAATFWWG